MLAGQPVHAPLALVAGCIVSMLVTTVALMAGQDWSGFLRFSTGSILREAEAWRVVSYVLWNPPSISFALQMLMLWWFGRELESFFGRWIFLKLCMGIVVVPALIGVAAGSFLPMQWVGLPGDFALFVAFATMVPGVTLLFGVSAKWTALIFLGVQLLSYAAAHAWGNFLQSATAAGFAFAYVRLQQGRWELPAWRVRVRKPQLRVLEPVVRGQTVGVSRVETGGFPEGVDALEVIDPLLEKIARSGMESLTVEERAQLELAREELIRRESLGR